MRNRRLALALLAGGIVVLFCAPGEARERPRHGELVELGRRLFMDPAVSRSGRFSCASCHDPERGFSDARVLSIEEDGPTRRHSQPLTDLEDGAGMHRDGEFDTVRELIEARLLPGDAPKFSLHKIRKRHFERAMREGRHPDPKAFRAALAALPAPFVKGNLQKEREVSPFVPVADRLKQDERYRALFERVYGTEKPKIEQLIDALEAYVLTLSTEENAFDRFLAGDPGALTAEQRRGFGLFEGKAGCTTCHSIEREGGRAPLTDRSYRNTGVALPDLLIENRRRLEGDGGRGEMTHVAQDLGRFKVPSLRDVGRRAPYMHDGSLETLRDVVEFYNRGGRPHDRIDPAIQPLRLTQGEEAALVAFLEALTAPRRGNFGPARPAYRKRLRIVDPYGEPKGHLAVRVSPFGDRLGDGPAASRPQELVTDRRGFIDFVFPAWTHVLVESKGFEIACGLPIPDSARELELRAVPKVQTFVEVVFAPSVPKSIEARDAKTSEVVAVLKRIRKIGGQRAIYEVTPTRRAGLVQVRLSNDPRRRGIVELDLRGGESEALTLPATDGTEGGYG